MTGARPFLRRLGDDRRGMSIVEFAIVAPVMLLAIMGLSDLGYRSYAQAILDGAMQKAGRDSTLEGAGDDTEAIDELVMEQVYRVAKKAEYSSTRQSFTTFDDVTRAEDFTDTNDNAQYDDGECFEDVNGNSAWDASVGQDGQGGANDVVLYEMTVTYPRLFPLAGMIGWSEIQEIKGMTLLKNQPYGAQEERIPEVICE